MANILGEIVKYGRGHDLLYEGYALWKDHWYEEKQHWRCTVVGCPGRAHTDFSDPPVILQSTNPNYEPPKTYATYRPTHHAHYISVQCTHARSYVKPHSDQTLAGSSTDRSSSRNRPYFKFVDTSILKEPHGNLQLQ